MFFSSEVIAVFVSYISFQISCNESKLSQTYVLYQFQATSWKLAALLIATWASAKSLSIVQQQRLREPFRISMVTIKYNHAEEIIQIVLMIATRKNRARKTDFFSVETAQFDIRCVITCLSSIEFPGHCCLYVGFFLLFCFHTYWVSMKLNSYYKLRILVWNLIKNFAKMFRVKTNATLGKR